MRTMRMTRTILAAALSTGIVSTAATAAAGEEGTGIELGARLGFGLPLGGATGGNGNDLSKVISNMFPIWLDAGYRILPNLYAGLYFMYGFGSVGSDFANNNGCNLPGGGCSVHDTRFGVNGQYHFTIPGPLEPWAGVGFGFEWLGGSVSQGGASGGFGASGFEFIDLQGGLDFKVITNLDIGPFLSLSFAQYDNTSNDGPAGSNSQSIQNKALHEWLMFGVRGTYVIHLF
jgi:hypothetical protein